eukprot:gb/GECH01003760.1/.p1 GENE.gb/GECH01003760.1/~~gb/GECH01003760.1/.p1  ORF type:complete len:3504 (+),score=578.80 gb/GECH01003760.1/:1-10512(+)
MRAATIINRTADANTNEAESASYHQQLPSASQDSEVIDSFFEKPFANEFLYDRRFMGERFEEKWFAYSKQDSAPYFHSSTSFETDSVSYGNGSMRDLLQTLLINVPKHNTHRPNLFNYILSARVSIFDTVSKALDRERARFKTRHDSLEFPSSENSISSTSTSRNRLANKLRRALSRTNSNERKYCGISLSRKSRLVTISQLLNKAAPFSLESEDLERVRSLLISFAESQSCTKYTRVQAICSLLNLGIAQGYLNDVLNVVLLLLVMKKQAVQNQESFSNEHDVYLQIEPTLNKLEKLIPKSDIKSNTEKSAISYSTANSLIDKENMTVEYIVTLIMMHLDRMVEIFMHDNVFEKRSTPPLIIQLHSSTFSLLHFLLKFYSNAEQQRETARARTISQDSLYSLGDNEGLPTNTLLKMFSTLTVLKLLKVNLTELCKYENSNSSDICSLFEKLREQDESSQDLLTQLKRWLLRSVSGTHSPVSVSNLNMAPNVIEATNDDNTGNVPPSNAQHTRKPSTLETQSISEDNTNSSDHYEDVVISQASKEIRCLSGEVISCGFWIFFPSSSKRIRFISDQLYHKSERSGALILDPLFKTLKTPRVLELIFFELSDQRQMSFYQLEQSGKPELLFLLLDSAVKSNKIALADLDENNSPVLSPDAELLFYIQNHLMSLAYSNSAKKYAASQVLSIFAFKLVWSCSDIIKSVAHYFQGSVAQQQMKLAQSYLQKSLIGRHLPSLIYGLYPLLSEESQLIYSNRISFANKMLKSVQRLCQYLCSIIQPSGEQHYQVLETQHPCRKPLRDTIDVNFDGALFLGIQFDRRCQTPSSSDYVEIRGRSSMAVQKEQKFFGDPMNHDSSSHWPDSCVLFHGDSLCLHVHLESESLDYWGVKCSVFPFYPPDWLEDLYRSSYWLGVKLASILVLGEPVSEEEKKYDRLMEFVLFTGGMETSVLEENSYISVDEAHLFTIEGSFAKFLHDFIENKGDSALLASYFYTQLGSELNLANYGGPQVDKAERAVIAAFIKQSGLVHHAFKLCNNLSKGLDKKISPKAFNFLCQVWRFSHTLRKWIVQKHQENPSVDYATLAMNITRNAYFLLRLIPAVDISQTSKSRSFLSTSSKVLKPIKIILNLHIAVKKWKKNTLEDLPLINESTFRRMQREMKEFLITEENLKNLERLLYIRYTRAFSRVKGLSLFQSLLSTAKLPKVQSDILEVFCLSLQKLSYANINPQYAIPHPRHMLSSCGIKLYNLLTKTLCKLYDEILDHLSHNHQYIHRIVLETLYLKFGMNDIDIIYYSNLLGKIEKIFKTQQLVSYKNCEHELISRTELPLSAENLEMLPWNTFRMVSAASLNMLEQINVSPSRTLNRPKKMLDKLSGKILSILSSLLKHIDEYNTTKTIEYVLALLIAISKTTFGKKRMWTSEFLNTVLFLLRSSSKEVVDLLVRLCDNALVANPPPDQTNEPIHLIVDYLLQMLGSFIFEINFGKQDSSIISSNFRIATNISNLFRTMTRKESWNDWSAEFFESIFSFLPDLTVSLENQAVGHKPELDLKDMETIQRRIFGVFGLLTGFKVDLEPLFVGTTELKGKQTTIVVKDVDRTNNKAEVMTQNGSESTSVPLESITLSTERPLDLLNLDLNEELLDFLSALLEADIKFDPDNPRIEILVIMYMRSKALQSLPLLLKSSTAIDYLFDSGLVKYLLQFALEPTKSHVGQEIKLNRCTFTFTSKNYAQQHWYHCNTCKIVQEEGICEVCADTCHRGHSLSYAGYTNFYCDCGNPETKHKCKCLSNNRYQSQDLISSFESEAKQIGELLLLSQSLNNFTSKSNRKRKFPFLPCFSDTLDFPDSFYCDNLDAKFDRTSNTLTFASRDEPVFRMQRSNIPLPPSVSLYYFELKITSLGTSGEFAVGFAPRGNNLEGYPGWYDGSVGYHGDDGNGFWAPSLYYLENTGKSYGPPFGVGDIVGCGFLRDSGTVFFTKNGTYLGPMVENWNGILYPVVSACPGSSAIVNFGQAAFCYDIKKLSNALDDEVHSVASSDNVLPLVQELVELGYSEQDSTTALNRVGRDLNAAAALLSHSQTEQLYSKKIEVLRKLGNSDIQARHALLTNEGDISSAAAWLEQNPGTAEFQIPIRSLAEIDFSEDFEYQEPQFKHSLQENLLKVTPPRAAAKIEDTPLDGFEFGKVVCISPWVACVDTTSKSLSRFAEKIGIVINKNKNYLSVAIHDHAHGETRIISMDLHNVTKAGCPFKSIDMTLLFDKASRIQQSLGIAHARKLFQFLMPRLKKAEWIENLVEEEMFLDYLRVSFHSSIDLNQNTFFEQLKDFSKQHLQLHRILSEYLKRGNELEKPIIVYLSNFIISQLNNYSNRQFHLQKFESLHTYRNENTLPRKVKFDGANALCITFDERSSLAPGHFLSFYMDEDCNNLVTSVSGEGKDVFRPIVIPSGTFWFKLSIQDTQQTSRWGYKFSVTPYNWNYYDYIALKMPNIRSAIWALSIIVSCSELLETYSNLLKQLIDSILRYILTPKTPLKRMLCKYAAQLTPLIPKIPIQHRPSLPLIQDMRIKIQKILPHEMTYEMIQTKLAQNMTEFMVSLHRNLKSDLCTQETHGYPIEQHYYKFKDKNICAVCSQQCFDSGSINYMSYGESVCTCGQNNDGCKALELRWKQNSEQHNDELNLSQTKSIERIDHSTWLDKFSMIFQVIYDLYFQGSFPRWFVNQSYIESKKQVVEKEISHPYKLVNDCGQVTIPGAAGIVITFDKRSRIDDFERLRFIKEGKEIFSASGDKLSELRVPIYYDCFDYEFSVDPATHAGFKCSVCNMFPIQGVRYTCAVCEDYDLCESCYQTAEQHDPTHIFVKIRRPIHLNPAPLPNLYPSDWQETNQFQSNVHHNTQCEACGMNPICGTLFKCENCNNFVLCEQCGTQEYLHHDRLHVFLLIRRPLPPREQLPANSLPYGLLYRKERSMHWGYAFKASPILLSEDMDRIAQENTSELEQLPYWMEQWNRKRDEQLVEYVNTIKKEGWLAASSDTIVPSSEDLYRFPLLEEVPRESLKARFALLQYFNLKIDQFLQFINFEDATVPFTLGNKISTLRGLIFHDAKLALWNKAIEASWSILPNATFIQLNRHLAAQTREYEDRFKRLRGSLFAQALTQLNAMDPNILMRRDRGWKVSFLGEGSDDYGGPYRESLTHMCEEIQSPKLPLFIHTPNHTNGVGFSREKVIPNPAFDQESNLEYYEFLGKLMGVAVRTQNSLALNFPSLIWKPLVSQPLDLSDLDAVDNYSYAEIKRLREVESHGITEEVFYSVYDEARFTCETYDNRTVELIRGGSKRPLTFENRLEYAKLLEQFKLYQCMRPTKAILRGLESIIPKNLLCMFTWQELEMLVCGVPDIDLETMKKNTIYEGYTSRSRVVNDFWNVLESFTAEQRSMFLRFVWGRDRLPPNEQSEKCLRLKYLDKPSPDEFLPSSHTCFFSFELPAYTSRDILREKVLYAITHCQAIDTDFVASSVHSGQIPIDFDE